MKVSVNLVPYEDISLGIRQYDSGLNKEVLDDIFELCRYALPCPHHPGFQCSIFGNPRDKILKVFNHPSIQKLEESFVKCCQSYWNLEVDHEVTGWVYLSWTDSPHSKPFWHRHVSSSEDYYRLSGVLYLTLPEDAETTWFSRHYDLEKKDFFPLPHVTNKWFIFPSAMNHLPGHPGNSNEMRICIAADYWIK